MILYPTTLIFQVTKAMQRALENLKHGKPMPKEEAVDMKEFEEIVELDYWKSIEEKFSPSAGHED
jgi:hypothetical protein